MKIHLLLASVLLLSGCVDPTMETAEQQYDSCLSVGLSLTNDSSGNAVDAYTIANSCAAYAARRCREGKATECRNWAKGD